MWTRADGCTKCMCMGGSPMCSTPMCAIKQCPPGVKHIKLPGSCCPVCEDRVTCTDENGKRYIEGKYWQKSNCDFCECNKGKVMCHAPTSVETCDGYVMRLTEKCGKVCIKTRGELKDIKILFHFCLIFGKFCLWNLIGK